MSKAFLVRHAESNANAGGRTTDPAKIDLTEKGFEQAKYLANAFKNRPDIIITSPYLRTKQTAKPLLERFGNIEEVEWAIQEFTYLSPERCKNSTTQERRPLVTEYWERNDPFFNDGVGAESFADLMMRVENFITQIKSLDNKNIVAFSHGQFIRATIWRVLNGETKMSSLEMKQFRSFTASLEIFNASTTIIQAEKDGTLWVSSIDKSYMPVELLS
jgi:broad specificity phosphatase PhoE